MSEEECSLFDDFKARQYEQVEEIKNEEEDGEDDTILLDDKAFIDTMAATPSKYNMAKGKWTVVTSDSLMKDECWNL